MDQHEKLKRLFEEHSAAEVDQDLARTLATCTEDVVYEHPFYPADHPDREIRGRAALGAYYRRSWSARKVQRVEIVRSWLSGDDCLVTEVFGILDGSGTMVQNVAIGYFRDGLLAKEIVYGAPH